MDAFAIHGGRLAQARKRFPGAPAPWIDLSTGVNPSPYPARPADPDARARLPDPEETAALEAAAARAFGLSPDQVLATAGAEAAIRLLAGALPAGRVAVAEPTYGGHGQAWRAAGARVTGFGRGDLERAAAAADGVVLVNPNNPDGAITPAGTLIDLARRMAARGGWLIVDEAYVETRPDAGLTAGLEASWPSEGLVALRSFGKFYGLPGLRLGFATAAPAVIARLRQKLGEWPVSADAIAAGLQAYADAPWAARARRELDAQAARLDALLLRAGLSLVGGTSLFRLAAAPDAPARFVRLAQAGVLTRPFDYAPNWLRLGLPAPEHWPRVEAALMEQAP